MIAVKLSSESPLSELEVLGLVSAHTIHTLSNQLLVLHGNLCAMETLTSEEEARTSALQEARSAADALGRTLDGFARLRAELGSRSESTPVVEGVHAVNLLLASFSAWGLRKSRIENEAGRLRLAQRKLLFVVDTILRETQAEAGEIQIVGQTNGIRIVLRWHGSHAINWERARFTCENVALTGAYQILAETGARPESRQIGAREFQCSFSVPFA